MTNRPHSRDKKVSNTTINVKKKPVSSNVKKPSAIGKIFGTFIKK